MKIDYYCFVADSLDCVISEDKRKSKSSIFDNLDFDMDLAKQLNKFAIYDKQTDAFYDKNNNVISLNGKNVFARCIIPDMNLLFDKLEEDGANLVIDKLRTQKVYSWPKFIQPIYRDVESMTYGEFLKNFDALKDKFGSVFFKTKKKNIHCEVLNVVNLQGMEFKSINSEDDLEGDDANNDIFFEPMYIVMTDKVKGFNDHRFMFLDKNEDVFVSSKLDIVKDHNHDDLPVEYRSFVIDGKFIVKRSWVPNQEVPEKVERLVEKTIEALPSEMPKTFVLDMLEFEKDGEKFYDICEFNPITCSGYEEGSSIFLLEDKFNNEMCYYKENMNLEKE